MKLFKFMYPSDYIRSIRDYDFDVAFASGKRLILFDIDNTMVPHGAPADAVCTELINKLKAKGFSLCAVSNNKEPRVKMFCDKVGVPYVFKADKPKASGYLKAVAMCGSSVKETLFFGDQIFTDIIGANRAGIDSILVRPIDRSTDEIQIKIKRIIEKPVIKAFFAEKGIAITDYFN